LKNNKLIIVIIILIILLLIGSCIGYKYYKAFQEQKRNYENVIEAATEEIDILLLDNGDLAYSKEILEISNEKNLKALGSVNSGFKRLQNDIDKLSKEIGKVQAGTNFITNTTFNILDSLNNNNLLYVSDSLRRYIIDSLLAEEDIIFGDSIPSTFKPWITGYMEMGQRHQLLSVKLYDEYSVITGLKKRTLKTLFKKREHYATIVSANPYSTVKEISAFNVTGPPRKRFAVTTGPSFGIFAGSRGLDYGGGITITVGYKLFEF
jgi:hypothetical protein